MTQTTEMTSALEMRQMAVLSTAHVSEATARMLDRRVGTKDGLNGGITQYGYVLSVPDSAMRDTNLPEDLLAVFALAKAQGADYLYLDRDGDTHPDLQVFDW